MLVAESTSIRRRTLESAYVWAQVPTAWGVAAALWNSHESESAGSFSHASGAVLSRIYTPGLALPELRRQIVQTYPKCHEVVGKPGQFHPETVPDWFNELVSFLQLYYAPSQQGGTRPHFKVVWTNWRQRLDWSQLTPFQRSVLEVVATIPSGTHLTYGQVAAKIGKPAASRAVGAAIGANPWPVLVPCHRVLGAGGKLTGFSAPGGIDTKRRMLALEQGA